MAPPIALASLPEMAARALPVLLDATAKGLVVLAAAGAATLLMRRASAAARQIVWFLALTGLLVLPVLSLALPAWQVLPSWARLEMATAPAGPSDDEALETQPPAAVAVDTEPALESVPAPPAGAVQEPPAAVEDVPPPTAATPATPWQGPPSEDTPGRPAVPSVLAWVTAAWAMGALACLAPLLLGRLSLWRLCRRCRRLRDEPWTALLDRARAHLGLRRPVVLLQSDRRTMPMIWGAWRPKLLLPGEADDWTTERRWVVILHELGHAKRLDCLTKLVAQLACAVYWFNPLAWLASRRFQAESERACDDLVLSAGSRPAGYAEHILEIASGLHAGAFATHSGIAMARKSELEGRLLAIMDASRSRRALTRLGVLVAAILIAGLVVPISILKATSPDKAAASPPEPTTQPAAKAKADLDARITKLVEQLGSPKYKEREAAQKGLVKIGLPAVGELQKAVSGKDPERALRAKRVLVDIEEKQPVMNTAALVAMWQREAVRAVIPAKQQALVARLLPEALAGRSPNLNERQAGEVRGSLRRYLGQFRPQFTQEYAAAFEPPASNLGARKYLRGKCYWTAWVLAQAAMRRPVPTETAQAVADAHAEHVARLRVALAKRLREAGFGEAEAARAAADFARRLGQILRDLRRDPLFPAFKSPVQPAWLRRVEIKKFPGYVADPSGRSLPRLVQRGEKRQALAALCAEVLAFAELVPKLNRTRAWGYMRFTAVGGSAAGPWCNDVIFRPNDQLNRARGWAPPVPDGASSKGAGTQPVGRTGASVSGRVLDKPGGKPAEGVAVMLRWRYDGTTRTTRTGAQGRYSFPNVKPSSYGCIARIGKHKRIPGVWTEGARVRVSKGNVQASDIFVALPSISGAVRDANTGLPVGGARIRLSTANRDWDAVKTDSKGRYRLNVIPRKVVLECRGTPYRYWPDREKGKRQVTVKVGDLIKGVDFTVRSAPAFNGRVLLPDGEPAREVNVNVQINWSGGPISGGIGDTFKLKTNVEGKFVGYMRRSIVRKWREKITLRAIARRADGSMGGVARAQTDTTTHRIAPMAIVLGKAASATIRVVGPDGKPIENAKVTASDINQGFTPRFDGPVKRLGDGRYRMTKLIPGLDYYMTATASGYRTRLGNCKRFILAPGQDHDAGALTLDWWGKKAVPGLVKKLRSGNRYARSACDELSKLGPDAAEAVPALIRVLNDGPRNTERYAAAAALGKIGSAAKVAVPDLIRALQQDHLGVPREAATALGRIGDPSATGVLKAALVHAELGARMAAATALEHPNFLKADPDISELLRLARKTKHYQGPDLVMLALGPTANRRIAQMVREVSDPRAPAASINPRAAAIALKLGRRLQPGSETTKHVLGILMGRPHEQDIVNNVTPRSVLTWWWRFPLDGPIPKAAAPDAERLEALWDKLTGEVGVEAYGATVALAAGGDGAVAFLAERIKPVTADDKRIRALIRELDDDKHAMRAGASAELSRIGRPARGALRAAMKAGPSAEVRARAEQLLAAIAKPYPVTADARQAARTIRVLELIGAPKAVKILQTMARGTPGALVTVHAQAALDRMRQRAEPGADPAPARPSSRQTTGASSKGASTQAAAAVPVDAPGWVKAVLAAMPGWDKASFRAVPSVVVNKRKGYRLALGKGRKEYLNLGQRQRPHPKKELRNAKFVMRYRHLELAVFQGAELPAGGVRKIAWTEWDNELAYYKKVVHLGQGMGMSWYANATIYDQEQLRQALKLQGGDDRLALLTGGLLVLDEGTWTRSSCVRLLARAGDKAIPYIKATVEKKKDGRKAIYALAFIQTDAATDYLKELYQAEATRWAATYTLVHQPFRKAAKKQYLDMLCQRTRIFGPAQACVRFGWKEAIPFLNEIYTRPRALREFEAAFQAKRVLEGKPVPDDLRKARQEVRAACAQKPMDQDALNRAKATMLTSKDTEAAAVIAIRLALFGAKASRDRTEAVRKLGREVLRQLPRKQTEKIVARLVKSLQANPSHRRRVKDLSRIFSP